jgi:trk system potassium uptake protein TrkH
MKTFVRYLGYLVIISAFFRIVPIVTALYYGEPLQSFLFVAGISLVLGGVIVFISNKWPEKKDLGLTLSGGLMLAALSFIILPLLGAISFLPSLDYNYINAAFESISGFTTTGITVYTDLDILPKSLLMWRAMTQWIGGIGIVMFFLFILTRLHSHDYIRLSDVEGASRSTASLYQAQGFTEKLGGGLKSSVSRVMMIYLGYTFIGIILLLFSGLSFFEAIALTFTSLSTGGFSVTNAFYSSPAVLGSLSLLMIIGSISFFAHNKLIQKKWKDFLASFEKNVFLLFLIFFILITLLVVPDVKTVGFMLISAFTTSGYALGPISMLPSLFVFTIMLGMLIGGSFASTSGGMKTYRIYYLFRAIPWSIKKLSSPTKAVIPLKVHGEEVNEAKLANIGVFVFAYVFILFVGITLFMTFGHNFMDSSFQVISALGTVGLQTMEIAPLNPILKAVLMLAMLLGRLEIFPILILIRNAFK